MNDGASSDWASVAHAVDAARQRGTVTLLVNPNDAIDVTMNPGYTFDRFVWPAVLAAPGLLLLTLGVALGVASRGANRNNMSAVHPNRTSTGNAVFAASVGVLCIGIATAVMVHAVHQRIRWAPVQARIDSVDVVHLYATRKVSKYSPRLWVAYEQGGHTYHRPVLTASESIDQFSAQQEGGLAWHAGPTRVFVNPSDPYQATLDPTSSGKLLLPVMFLLVGLGCLALARYRWMARRRAAG